jgi:translation initiation factor 1
MAPRSPTRSLVYSTELGRTCPQCRRSLAECRCREQSTRIVGDGQVRVGRESKGRGGKVVTLVTGLPVTAAELAVLATRLKKRCGTGGTVKDGTIEIQGEHRETIVVELVTLGFKAKRAG